MSATGYVCSQCGRAAVVANMMPDRHLDASEAADCADARGDRGWYAVYVVAPWNTSEECDHQGAPAGACSHCCSCVECGMTRARA